jgi:hypothetical protein
MRADIADVVVVVGEAKRSQWQTRRQAVNVSMAPVGLGGYDVLRLLSIPLIRKYCRMQDVFLAFVISYCE